MGVAVGQRARAVGGEVEAAVVVADAQRYVGAGPEQSLDAAGEGCLPVAVVEFEDAIGVVAAQGEGVGEGVGAAGKGALPATGGEASGVEGQSPAGRAGAAPCEDLVTVTRTWGSAPRRAGSHMVIAANGDFSGSVSGGCIEGAVIQTALEVIESGEPRRLEFGVTNEMAWEVGLACGGRVYLFVEPVNGRP